MHRPYSIKIFLPAGDPDGLRTIEKSNWSGCGIAPPRSLSESDAADAEGFLAEMLLCFPLLASVLHQRANA